MITRDFDLWITQGHTKRLVFNANQYDQGETWRFRILGADGNPIVPTTAAIIGQKKDGHAILVQGTVSDGKVVITETEQMTACAGLTEFELLLNGETHGTANFTVQVEKRPGDDADLSDSDLSLIQDAVDAAETITEVIGDGDPSEVIGEHVDAWLDAHPEATTTVQDGAITAPKINQSLWDKLLVSEEASGAVASFDDGADDVPVSSLKVALEPIQTGSGDPSPSNVRPIIAANGKNMIPVAWTTETKNGVTATANADGTVTLTGTATANATFYVETTYTLSEDMLMTGCPSGGSSSTYVLWARTSANAYINDYGNGVTIPSGTSVTRFAIVVINGQTVNNLVFKPMIRPVSITDASYQPYQGIMVDVQSGNLAHLIDETRTGQGITSTVASEKITATGTATSTYANLNYLHPINIVNGQTYTVMLSKAISNAIVFRFATDTSDSTYQQVTINAGSTKATFTANNNFALFRVYIGNLTSGTAVNISDLQILVGNGDISAFVPYSLTSYPYTLGQSVYGGTVDLVTGVLTLTKGFKNITASDNVQTVGSSGHGWQVLNSSLDIPPLNKGENYSDGIICDRLKSEVGASSVADDICFVNTSGVLRFNLATVYADKTALFAVLGEINVAYPIEPQTINLTPTQVKTLLGYNNISSTGTVDVIYHADTKLYVDKMTNVDNAIIAPTEADFVATRNYTVGDLVIVNDTLYKVTANIASGSTITPNSNVTQTTLGALIKALS